MFNQPGINPDRAHSDDQKARQESRSQPPSHQERTLPWGWWLLVLLILGGIATGLERSGITNVVRSFGQGGRPVITIGLWHITDVPDDLWAQPFIEGLLQKRVISGYPNDTFRPEQAVTRAEFAAMVNAAMVEDVPQTTLEFEDVSSDFWGTPAIRNTITAGFFTGYPQGTFRPNQPLLRTHAFAALSKGLELSIEPTEGTTTQVLSIYEDAAQIPEYAREAIAAATVANLVIHEPSTAQFNPNQPMTRAEAAAAVYQTLVYLDEAEPISSPYLVER